LVYSHEGVGDPQQLFAKALAEELHPVRDERFLGVRVLEYER